LNLSFFIGNNTYSLGGDQIYCDDVFELGVLKPWIGMRNKAKRMMAEYTLDIHASVQNYYFTNSLRHCITIGFKLRTIPFNFTWDDHDIFDGYGSYPVYLQTSTIFRGIFQVALRFYLLFQQHTNLHLYQYEDIGAKSHSTLYLYGSTLAVISPDVRSERTLENVIPEKSWDLIWRELDQLPCSVNHLLVNATIPLAYPRVGGEQVFSVAKSAAKGARNLLNNLQKLAVRSGSFGSLDEKSWADAFCKTGAFQTIVNSFGEPELMDDLNDHWTNELHNNERVLLVQRLQQFAQRKKIRVTLCSGDVHVGGCAKFYSSQPTPIDQDFRFMYQLISSAIGIFVFM
jgi:hypothetical protein